MGGSGRLTYQPALDGVRAIAVLAVLLFHAGTPGFGGGYLGVSVFFTLSGYLITSLLVDEHDQTGTIDFRRFYARRLRRLLPASVATVAVIVAIAALTDIFDGVAGLRAQVVGALLQVSNWVQLVGDTSYQDLLAQASGTVSPLEHFWSLAIEEQFYWLWPPLMLLMLSRMNTTRARLVALAVLTGLAMAAAPVIAQVWGPDAAYWATPARLGEILVGALLAMTLRAVRVPNRMSLLAPVSLGVLAVAVIMFPSSSGPAYEGYLPLIALASAALIVGLQHDGACHRVLSTGPLVALGKISYGVYLVHWPVFVIVDAERIGVDGALLTVVRLAITLVIAVGSYHLLERPIRLRQRVPFRTTIGVAGVSTIALVSAALVVLPSGSTSYWQSDPDALAAAAIDTDSPAVALTRSAVASTTSTIAQPVDHSGEIVIAPTSTDPGEELASATTLVPLPELDRPVRIVVTGDSTADALGTGVVAWAAANPELAQVQVQAALGCGFLMGGERLWGEQLVSTSSCIGWPEAQLFPVVERTTPDVVAVMVSVWDLVDRQWDGGELLGPDDPEFHARLVDTYTALVDDLVASGAVRVALIREPVPNDRWRGSDVAENDARRHAALADVFDEVEAARPDIVRGVDLAAWLTETDFAIDGDARPDGIHLAPASAQAIATEFLGDQLIRAAVL